METTHSNPLHKQKNFALDDNSAMPFGKHKGVRMCEIGDEYFIYLYKNDLKPGNVKTYIESHIDMRRLTN